jgi:hypothetical protein
MWSYSSNSSKLKALFAFIHCRDHGGSGHEACRFGNDLIFAKPVEDAKAAMKAASILQEAEPCRGPAKGREDEGRGVSDMPLTMISIRDYLKYLQPCPMSLHQDRSRCMASLVKSPRAAGEIE